jgi:TP901 family phage tail tape measure protein
MAKKKLRDEDLVLNIIVNGDQGQKEILDLEKAIKQTNRELRQLERQRNELINQGKKETAEYKAVVAAINLKNSALDKARGRIAQLRQGMNVATMSVSDLRREITRLTKLRNIAPPGSKEFEQWQAQLDKVKARFNELTGAADKTGGFLGKVLPGKLGIGIARIGAFGLATKIVVQQVSAAIQPFAQFDDVLADVRKTTGLTNAELNQLNDEIKSIDSRSSQEELLRLARTAGKLGIDGKEDIMGFVRAADQIGVALAEDLGGDVEQALRQVGKLVDIFKVREEFGIEEGLLKVGSVINELGISSTASEQYMVDFAKRLAGVAPAAKISIDNVLAYASTLDQLGQSAEVAGTTFVNLIPNLFTSPEKFARIAGIEIEEFNKLLNTDTNEALIRLFEGIKGNESSMTEMAQRLVELGLDGARATNVVSALANNTELLRKEQGIANRAMTEGISLTNEFAIKNETLGAQLDKIGKYFYNIYMNSALREGMRSFFGAIADILYATEETAESFGRQAAQTQRLTDTIDPLLSRYEHLSSKTNRSTEENEELKNVINQLSSLVPQAVTEFDAYGNAMDINAGKVREFSDAQKDLMEFLNSSQIEQVNMDINSVTSSINDLQKALNTRDSDGNILKTVTQDFGMGQTVRLEVKATTEEVAAMRAELAKLQEQQKKSKNVLAQLRGENPDKPAEGKPDAGTQTTEFKEEIETLQTLQDRLKALQEVRQGIATSDLEALKKNEADQRAVRARIEALEIDFSGKAAKESAKEAERKRKEAEKEAKRQEEEARKLAEKQEETRRKAIISQLREVSQEKIAYEERLKEAGLYYVNKKDLTSEQQLALEAMEKDHLKRLNAITSKEIDTELKDREAEFKSRLDAIRILHNEEFKSIHTMEQAREFLRDKVSADTLRGIKNMRQAQQAIDKVFLQEEEKLAKEYLTGLMLELQGLLDSGQMEGIDLADTILSDEQKVELQARIDEIKLKLSEMGLASNLDQFEDKGKRSRNVDILGMSTEDWEIFQQNLENGKVSLQDMLAVAQSMIGVYSGFAQARSRQEEAEFAQYEQQQNKKKNLLKQRLDIGLISEETYNQQVEKLDADLDKKKAVLDANNAKRERNVALMSAIVNTANAVTSALTIPPPLGIILAGIVGAMGLAEVKTITGTPLPEIPGAESGGFVDVVRSQDGKMYRAKKSPDHRGFVHSPTVITGEDGSEFIANADAVTNPTIKPVMDIIDTAQRQGTVQSLDLFRVLEENRQLRAVYPGRAKGGRISPSAAQAPEPSMPSRSRADEDTRELLKQNYRINSLLLERLKKPLKSNVTLTGPGSLQEKQDELNVIQKSANL